MGSFVTFITTVSCVIAQTAVLEDQPQIPSNTLRYRHINLTSSNGIVDTEQIYGSTEVICSLHKTVASFIAMTGAVNNNELLIQHPRLLAYCKHPSVDSISFGIVTWPHNSQFNNVDNIIKTIILCP